MRKTVLLALLAMLALDVTVAVAQDLRSGRRRHSYFDHKVEINVFGGYMWTTSRSFSIDNVRGELDIKNSGYWGAALDFNVKDGVQLEALYTRQDSELTFTRPGGTRSVLDATLEYLQAGAVVGVPKGKLMPFTNLLLGATHLNPNVAGASGSWKFSMTLGIGAKYYMSQRFGLRFHGRLPYTFTGGGSLICLEDGTCYEAIGGVGIPQLDLGAGLIIMF